jgi:MFS family permease
VGASTGARTGYRAALRSPIVRRLWLASLASTVGDYIGLGALLFLATDQTGLALGAATVLAVGIVPSLFTGIVGGRWLDRFDRARALASIQLLGAVVICLPVVFEGTPIVFVTAALLSAVRIATIAVRSGAMAEGIDDDNRGPLVALIGSTDQASQVIGFFTGGAIYVLLGAQTALLIDAASFVLGAVVLAGLELPRPAERPDKPPLSAGLRDILADPVLRLLAALVVVTGTVASLPETLAPSIAQPDDPWRAAVLASAPVGQVIAMTVLGRLPQVRRTSFMLLHFTLLAASLALAALARTPATFALANLLVGAGTAWIVGAQLAFLRRAPKLRMAQITGTIIAGLAVAEGLGSLGFAAVADTAGVRAAYALSGVLLALAAVLAWWARSRTPAALALDAEPLHAEPLDAGAAAPTSDAVTEPITEPTSTEPTMVELDLGDDDGDPDVVHVDAPATSGR